MKYGNRERRLGLLAEIFSPYASIPFDDAAAEAYATIRHDLEMTGGVIGPYDLMIAATALANSLTLVTHNTAEFGRIVFLQIEDWQT
jgi:tRNA(fMet)-specific endonuclease VapC